MSTGVVAIGVTNLSGYIFNEPQLYTWLPNGIGMALPTAIAFVLTGASLLLLSCKRK